MNRVLGIAGAMLLSLLILVPVAAADEPFRRVDHFMLDTGGDMVLPADQHVDLLVVVDGDATIAGNADGVIVVNGTARFTGGSAGAVVAVNSDVSLDATSTISGDVRTFDSAVDQAPGATVSGRIVEGPDRVDWVALSVVVATLAFLAYLGLVLVGIAAGLVTAAVAARQVRATGALITNEPGPVFLAGLGGLFGIILVSVLAIITIVGIPLGLVILLGVLPALGVAGWLVAGIWIGDQILARITPTVTRERPYLAAVTGLIILSALNLVPIVGAVASFFGFGSVILMLWRTFRGMSSAQPAPTSWVTPAAG